MKNEMTIRATYKNHQTGEKSVTYWRTQADCRAWYGMPSYSEYGCAAISDYETVSMQRVDV